ncbi:MAG: class I SAM-dependent DNA methyltransferase [Candidatus Bathyarchaeia archaeon]|jgi:type I restriction enzyme M protein
MISTTIKSIQDIMRQDAGVDGDAQRISQMVWMIFLKVYDDKEKEWELEDEKYQSAIPEKYRWRNWASNKEGITGDDLLDFIGEMFKALKALNASREDDPKGFIVREVFEDAYNYMKSGTLIRQVINKLNEIDFNKSEDKHLFNEVYEKIISDLQSAGNAGEYYTPRAVTQFIVDIINPKFGERVLDPACGTGGFLVSSLENMKKQITRDADLDMLQKNINGVEKKPLPHLLCTTNMILHGIEVPNIRHDNTLTRPLADYGPSDMVDVVVTNPPFGGIEEPGIELNFPSTYRTRETADLFLVLIMKLLRDEGRCGMVLPDGFLFGEGAKTRIKEKLLLEFNLHTIVRLPNGVFNPYTGIRTNLLFFEKGKPTKEIWYFEHPYPEGYKSYNKTKPIQIEEFDLEKEWWNDRENDKFSRYCWKVSIGDVKKRNYNMDINNPKELNETENMTSKEIIELLEKSMTGNAKLLEQIRKELGY